MSEPKAYKSTITLTVFSDTPLAAWQVADLGYLVDEIDTGLMVGNATLDSEEEVSGDTLRTGLVAIGNDGSFFDSDEEEA